MTKKILPITLIIMLLANAALAGGHRDRRHHHGERHGRAWARVVDVHPIRERIRVVTPRELCRTDVVREHHVRRRSHAGPTILGAGIGGAIGSRIGGRDRGSRIVGGAMGAIIGGVVGNELSRAHGRDHRRHRYSVRRHEVRRCKTVDEVSWERHVVGYRVAYKYAGRIYHTHMEERPGRRIRVNVDVRPRHRF